MKNMLVTCLILFITYFLDFSVAQSVLSQGVQCYACGLPNIQPDNDIAGSYPNIKTYNHSCDEMMKTRVKGTITNKFVRTCPLGVVSCFGATGLYDHGDNNPANDIFVTFLGCSEAIYNHNYGCDKDIDQPVQVKDMANKDVKVHINVKICFCNDQLCNDPTGDLMSSRGPMLSAYPSNIYSILIIILVFWTTTKHLIY